MASRLDPICEHYLKLIKCERLKVADIDFRHVKAHVNGKDPTSFVNEWCDKAAKESLQELIKEEGLLKKKIS